VAQWLAQATHNRLVAGSTPAGPTFFPPNILFVARIQGMVFDSTAGPIFFPPNILFVASIQGMVFDSSRAYIFHHFFFPS
jgi:hypothetical protein